MSTDMPKILFHLPDDLLKRLDDYRIRKQLNFRSEAIRLLIEKALAAEKKGKKPPKK